MSKKFPVFLLISSVILSNQWFYQVTAILNNDVDFRSLDFEQLKNQLFSNSKFKYDIQNIESNPKYDIFECEEELEIIKESLKKKDLWITKLLDSWGKIPPGILSGNDFEFGAFKQCFNVDRNNSRYRTQYCMGQLNFDLKGLQNPSHDDVFQAESNVPMPRVGIQKPKSGQSLKFGTCLPAVCPPIVIENAINLLIISQNLENVSIEIPEALCQFKENHIEFGTADWFAIGLLAAVLCLMTLSTCYDVRCTLENKPKTQALLAFSVYTNGKKLLSYEAPKTKDMMHCLNGIRVISTQWVILGHTYAMFLLLPIQNKIYFTEFVQQYQNMFVMSGVISVDTFFVLSGLLVSFNMLKHFEKSGGRINVILLYVHRYLRLTPLLAVSVLFTTTILRFFGNGPLWPSFMQLFKQQCERHWLSMLLYTQNYKNPDEICFGHSWYLSVDTQLFLIAPLVMYLIYKFRTRAIVGLSLMILGCIGCTITTFVVNDFRNGFMNEAKMEKTYYPTHLRFSPWLIGVFGGYILHENRKRLIFIPRIINLLGWIVSSALMGIIIFANYPLVQLNNNVTALEQGLYESLSRVAWALALCYIIFACVHGHGGPVNWLLSHPLWQPLSRLCYSIYLIHFPIVFLFHGTMKTTPYFTEAHAFHTFIGNFVVTVFVSIFASLAFESPMIIIEKIIFGKRNEPRSAERDLNQTPVATAPEENGKC